MRLIDADKGLISKIQRETGCNFITAQKIVDSMSTVEERKVGKWIMPNKYYDKNIWRKCSVCNTHFEKYHKYIAFTGEVTYTEEIANYCKVCGAEMVGVENG